MKTDREKNDALLARYHQLVDLHLLDRATTEELEELDQLRMLVDEAVEAEDHFSGRG
jgi:hypothetical protein